MSKVDFKERFKGEVLGKVKAILLFDEGARDDANLLYLNYIIMYHNIDRKKENVNGFFSKLMSKEIPSMEYIARCKRKIQSKEKELRGVNWKGKM